MRDDRNATDDALAAELRALRPAPLPPSLSARIGRELSDPAQGSGHRWWWFTAAGIAACLFAGVVLWRVSNDYVDPIPVVVAPPTTSPGAELPPGPALAAYRLALSRSPAELDVLLDRHARTSLTPDRRPPVRAGAVTGVGLHE